MGNGAAAQVFFAPQQDGSTNWENRQAASTIGSNGTQIEDLGFDDASGNPGVVISGALTLTEGGSSGTASVTLNTQPTANVTVDLSADPALSLSASTLTFTPQNWSTAQTVSVSAVTDGVAEGYHTAVIQTSTEASDDPDYNLINGQNLTVAILDVDGPNAGPVSTETPGGTPISINVLSGASDPNGYSLSVTGYTQGDSGGMVTMNSDQSLAYTPPSNFSGGDHFTYTVTNSNGQSTTGDVFVSVDWVDQTPVLGAVAPQTNNEDDNVSLQINGSDLDGDQVYYTATNLPPGLEIDQNTGLISGILATNAANPMPFQPPASSHTYQVTIQGQDSGGNIATTTFNWTVNHINHAPWLEYPGALTALATGSFGGQFVGHDDDIMPGMQLDTLTYSIAGAPGDLTLDSSTGRFYGPLALADVGTYTPTVTVSDGHTTASQTFTLTVLPTSYNFSLASIEINNTADFSDDVMLDGTSVPALIVGQPGESVSLQTTGPATLSQSQVTLDQNGQATVQIISTGPSTSLDDIHVQAFVAAQAAGQPTLSIKSDEKTVAQVKVTLPDLVGRIDPYNTLPAAGTDPLKNTQNHPLYRIRYRETTLYLVTLSQDLSKDGKFITISAQGTSAANGNFAIEGAASAKVSKLQNIVELVGTAMTTPDNTGKLFIQATDGTNTTKSKTFSVSAIPIKLRLAGVAPNPTGDTIPVPVRLADGTKANVPTPPYSQFVFYYFDSDSGPKQWADLDQVWIGEFVVYTSAASKAVWSIDKDIPVGTNYVESGRDKLTAATGTLFDRFLVFGDKLPKTMVGSSTLAQWYGFHDNRSEVSNAKDTTHQYQNDIAYFVSTREVRNPNGNNYFYQHERQNLDGQFEPANALVVKIQ